MRGSRGLIPWKSFNFARCAILGHFFHNISQFYRPFHLQTEIINVFAILTPKLRITDLGLSTTEITEVSVVFTDGWQHLSYQCTHQIPADAAGTWLVN